VRHRQTIAILALAGFFLSLYLWLWKIGRIGSLQCGTGGCERVQTSAYADFLGVPVAFYGVVGYAALLAVSLVGLQPRWLARREPTFVLLALASLGVAFTGYLSYLEFAVIEAWCRWCLGSAALITAIWVTALAATLPSLRTGP
jgi:uncharacterized membrane protein